MHLADALLIWLNAKTARMEGLNGNEDDCTCILEQVHVKNVSVYSLMKYLTWVFVDYSLSINLSILAVEQICTTLLPLWFAAGMLDPRMYNKKN